MSVEPTSPGYALPEVTASLSPAAPLARAATLRNNVSSHELRKSRVIIDQGKLPSCVSSALAAALEVLNAGWPRLAPLFHYYVTRHERSGANSKGFLYLKNSLTTLDKVGICKHELHQVPFDEAGSRSKPTAAAYADALTRAFDDRDFFKRFRGPGGPSRAVWMREQLRQDRPVIVGFQLPAGYDSRTFLNPRFEWLNPHVPLAGIGHCVLVRGYDDLRQAFHIQDCHGAGEFEQGCWWMGYRVADSNIVQEVYCLIP